MIAMRVKDAPGTGGKKGISVNKNQQLNKNQAASTGLA